MGCIEKHVGWRKKATICVWSVNDVGNFVEKVLHHPEHQHSMCVCEINSFREEIKVKTDAGQKDDKFFTSCHEKLCPIYL